MPGTQTITYFLAPHKNQTVNLRVTDELIDELERADSVETMSAHYRKFYDAGRFGNKQMLQQLRALRQAGIGSVAGKVAEHVEAQERIDRDGNPVMVISSEEETELVWAGPWEDQQRPSGTLLRPTDFELAVVELAA